MTKLWIFGHEKIINLNKESEIIFSPLLNLNWLVYVELQFEIINFLKHFLTIKILPKGNKYEMKLCSKIEMQLDLIGNTTKM